MLRRYLDDHQQNWNAYAPALTCTHNSQVYRSTNTTLFYLMFNWDSRTLHLTLKCLLEKFIPLPNIGLDSKVHNSTHWTLLSLSYRPLKNYTKLVLTGVYPNAVRDEDWRLCGYWYIERFHPDTEARTSNQKNLTQRWGMTSPPCSSTLKSGLDGLQLTGSRSPPAKHVLSIPPVSVSEMRI